MKNAIANVLTVITATAISVGAFVACDKGCSTARVRTLSQCDDDQRDKRAQFILDCIANANPRSDEEPEDWIEKCESMGRHAYCKEAPAFQYTSSGHFTSPVIPCTKATTPAELRVCGLDIDRDPK